MSEHQTESSLRTAGIPEAEDVVRSLPPPERLSLGPVALIECFQEIPCDPCADACPERAIGAFEHMCALPLIDHEVCNGCGLCVVRCPGLAIFVVDLSRDDGTAEIKLPYEYTPLPAKGEQVVAVDRHGREAAKATVQRVQRPKGFDRTALVTLRVPAQAALTVRGLRLLRKGGEIR